MAATRFASDTAGDADARTLSFGAEFDGAHCLLNAEVTLLLEDIQARRAEEASRLALPPPSRAFLDSLAHARFFAGAAANREVVRSTRQILLHAGLHEFEMAQLGNLLPESVEDAKVLVPSLAERISDDALAKLLDDLASVRHYEK